MLDFFIQIRQMWDPRLRAWKKVNIYMGKVITTHRSTLFLRFVSAKDSVTDIGFAASIKISKDQRMGASTASVISSGNNAWIIAGITLVRAFLQEFYSGM